jgi:hypothetical protein
MAISVKFDFHWIFVSIFENMVICVEILLSLDISVKYAQCVKIWLFLKCVQFPEVLCSVSNGHYTEFDNCSISNEEKGTRALNTRVSHLIKRRRVHFARVLHMGKGRRALMKRVSLLPKRIINRIFTKRWLLH